MFPPLFQGKGIGFKRDFLFSEEIRPAEAYTQRGVQPLIQFEFKFLPACVWFLSCQVLFLHRCLTGLFFFSCGLEHILGS